MKYSLFAGAVAASVMVVAHGATVQVYQGPYSSGSGGEFNAYLFGAPFTPVSLAGGGQHETFCIELGETFSPGGTYNVTFLTAAIGGSGGASGGQDPLDERTAWLYSAFISGVLPGYDYSNGLGMRQANAGSLQNAVWYLEQEVGSLDTADAVAYYNFSAGGIGQGIGSVRVMHLFTLDASGAEVAAQDMLVKIPAPGSVALLGLAGLAGRRRR